MEEDTGRERVKERGVDPPPPPPLSPSPNPLAGRTAEGRREERRRSGPEGGVRSEEGSMTTMLSPKIRQTRRGESPHPPRFHGNGTFF